MRLARVQPRRGADPAKKIIGRGRHIVTDTLGLLLAVTVTAAGTSSSGRAVLRLVDAPPRRRSARDYGTHLARSESREPPDYEPDGPPRPQFTNSQCRIGGAAPTALGPVPPRGRAVYWLYPASSRAQQRAVPAGVATGRCRCGPGERDVPDERFVPRAPRLLSARAKEFPMQCQGGGVTSGSVGAAAQRSADRLLSPRPKAQFQPAQAVPALTRLLEQRIHGCTERYRRCENSARLRLDALRSGPSRTTLHVEGALRAQPRPFLPPDEEGRARLRQLDTRLRMIEAAFPQVGTDAEICRLTSTMLEGAWRSRALTPPVKEEPTTPCSCPLCRRLPSAPSRTLGDYRWRRSAGRPLTVKTWPYRPNSTVF